MCAFVRKTLLCAAASAFITLTAASAPTSADDLVQNLGPVEPYAPILTTVGDKRVIAFFVPGNNRCALHAAVWDTEDADAGSVTRVRVSLLPGQIIHIDRAEGKSINLQCDSQAATLGIVGTDTLVVSGLMQWWEREPY